MIYLIGTNHEIQHTGVPKRADSNEVQVARRDFESYLFNAIGELQVVMIAEEFTDEILKCLNAKSIAYSVACKQGIEHRFCDPTTTERMDIGFPPHGTEKLDEEQKMHFHGLRERFWLNKISDCLSSSIILICGAEHVESFQNLLDDGNIENKILIEYLGSEIYT